MPRGSSRVQAARTKARTFNGCSTCRARKVKCDERRPSCEQCEKRRLDCGGFEAKIQYVLYDPARESFRWSSEAYEPRMKSSRRPLFTGMSLQLFPADSHGRQKTKEQQCQQMWYMLSMLVAWTESSTSSTKT